MQRHKLKGHKWPFRREDKGVGTCSRVLLLYSPIPHFRAPSLSLPWQALCLPSPKARTKKRQSSSFLPTPSSRLTRSCALSTSIHYSKASAKGYIRVIHVQSGLILTLVAPADLYRIRQVWFHPLALPRPSRLGLPILRCAHPPGTEGDPCRSYGGEKFFGYGRSRWLLGCDQCTYTSQSICVQRYSSSLAD
jgi:hypothetical protein